MKKTIALFALLLLLLSFPVCAVSGRLSAGAVSGKAGEQVTVTVRLDNPGIVATRIFVRYDSAVLRLDSAENGDVFAQSCAVFGKDTNADPYTMLWDDSLRKDNNTTSGTLCTLRFTILKAPSEGETSVRIAVDKASTFDVDLNEVTVADGTCRVQTGGASTPAKTTIAPDTTTTKPAPKTTAATTVATTKPITAASATAKTSAVESTPPPKASSAAGSTSSSAKTTANASASVTKEESGTTTTTQTVPEIAGTTAAETESVFADTLSDEKAGELSQSGETEAASAIETIGATKPARHVNLLWLLVLVPVAAGLAFILLKKKK